MQGQDSHAESRKFSVSMRSRRIRRSSKTSAVKPAARRRDIPLGGNNDLVDKACLAKLTDLASVEIETSLAQDLSRRLHDVFGDICDEPLPIYFGPLLGRLFLEGL